MPDSNYNGVCLDIENVIIIRERPYAMVRHLQE